MSPFKVAKMIRGTFFSEWLYFELIVIALSIKRLILYWDATDRSVYFRLRASNTYCFCVKLCSLIVLSSSSFVLFDDFFDDFIVCRQIMLCYPSMLSNFCESKPLIWVPFQHLIEQIFEFFRDNWWIWPGTICLVVLDEQMIFVIFNHIALPFFICVWIEFLILKRITMHCKCE